jgi:hypothetical protein
MLMVPVLGLVSEFSPARMAVRVGFFYEVTHGNSKQSRRMAYSRN